MNPESPVTAERPRPLLQWTIWVLAAAAVALFLIVGWELLPVGDVDVFTRVQTGIEALRDNPWRVPLVLLAFVIGGLLAFPILVLVGATIVAFGPLEGFVLASVGTMLAASVSFGTGRLVGRPLLQRFFGHRLAQFESKLRGRGVIAVALIRNVPGPPFTITNMLIAAAGIHFREFVAGTALVMLPAIALFAFLGHRLAEVWRHPTPLSVTLVVAAVALWIGALIGTQRFVNRFGKK